MNEHTLKQFEMAVSLKDKVKPILEGLEKQYGINDFRHKLVGVPVNSVILQILIFKSAQSTFYNNDWWDSINVPTEGRKGFAEKYDLFTKYLIFIQFFSYVESEFRILVQKISPGACNNGKSAFYSIYKKVLTDLSLTKYIATFDFARSIRNAIHNNGYYRPEKDFNDIIIEFKSIKYKFEYGKPIDFFYPELVVEIEDEIFNCLIEIIGHPKIICL